ncbi:hypothetical protein C8R46DRAFT_1116707 [Mycena filopes]|nr:hypothetical protein C8R46DRAFT_1116707 [Mycena filopes]
MSASHCSQCGAIRSPPGKDPLDSVRVAAGSPHYTLLNSNKPPLDGESRPVKAVISKIDEKLASLVDTMAALRERLKELEEEHASLSSYRAQNLAIISPLRRLPFEVLGEIFSWTLEPVSDARNRPIGFSPMYSPWVLTHVSQRWRVVAVSSSALWSLFMLIFDDALYQYPMAMLETQLERARNLKIHFYGSQAAKSQSQIDIFRYLAAHAARWEELSVELTSDLVPLLDALQDRLPVLRRLSVAWAEAESQEGVHSIDSFQSAPSLVDVAVSNCHRFVSIPFPSNQLTCYDLDAPWSVHNNLLVAAPNLVQARVTADFDTQPWPPASTIIRLLYLRRLYVSDTRVLVYLHLPMLEELVLEPRNGDGPSILEHLQDALQRSPFPLRKLLFIGCPDAYSLTSILQKLPMLAKLAMIIEPETAHKSWPSWNGLPTQQSHRNCVACLLVLRTWTMLPMTTRYIWRWFNPAGNPHPAPSSGQN